MTMRMRVEDLPHEMDNLHLGEFLIPHRPQLQGGVSVLQCGARPGDGWVKIFKCFQKHGYSRFDVLEIHEPNYKWLCNEGRKIFPLRTVEHGDIRLIDTYETLDDQYDVVIFWHGWEHCTKEETKVALPKVMAKCRRAHICGMPWGRWDQAAIKNNPHEKHVYHWYPEDLDQLGFDECFTFNASSKGRGPDKHNVLYGVKYVNQPEE